MTDLRIADDLALPVDAATETFGILAKKGAGKSNAAVVMAEEMHAAGVPWVAIDPKGDWWGLRSSGDGKGPGIPLPVFGGRHGDIPLEPGAGAMLADLVLAERLTCVLDVSEFSKADVTRFLLAFADRLYRQADAEPLHLFLEEAHEYLPQMVRGDQANLVGAWQRIVKQGRFKGLGCTLISQRSASLNKDVLTQVDTLIVLRTTSPQDRAAVKAWVDVHADSAAMLDTLPTLAAGEAWVWSPEFLGTLQRIKFRRRRTFDSGATPKVGEARRAPATLADVDLASIKEQMADVVERAKADDPKELNKRIRDLERQLAARPAAEPEVVIEHVEVIPAWLPEVLGSMVSRSEGALINLTALGDTIEDLRRRIEEDEGGAPSDLPGTRPTSPSAHPVAPPRPPQRPHPPAERPASRPTVPRPPATDDDADLSEGALRILTTLARSHPLKLTRGQVGAFTSYSIGGGAFQGHMRLLKRLGYLVEDGGLIAVTTEGLDAAGVVPGNPITTDEVLALWRGVLTGGALAIFNELVAVYPLGMHRADLAERVGMTASGGAFQGYVRTLKRNNLADTNGSDVVASASLFPG